MNSPSCVANQDPEEESTTVPSSSEATKGSEKAQDDGGCGGGEEVAVEDPMEVDAVNPATVFCIGLQQPRSNLMHKMSVPELCRNFSSVAWCGKLNAIACASETCARIPSSNANPPFWIPIHIVIPERPTECSVFNVIAVLQINQLHWIPSTDSPRDSVQFMEWSPTSCPRALLIANFHGRITVWTQPSEGLPNPVRDASCWQREHEWRQDIAVVTKWLSGLSPYRWLSSRSSSSTNSKSAFEEKFLSLQPQAPGSSICLPLFDIGSRGDGGTPRVFEVEPFFVSFDVPRIECFLGLVLVAACALKDFLCLLVQQMGGHSGWPNFLCVCSVFSSGSVQLHWSQWPLNQSGAASKWCSNCKLEAAGDETFELRADSKFAYWSVDLSHVGLRKQSKDCSGEQVISWDENRVCQFCTGDGSKCTPALRKYSLSMANDGIVYE
ncbi:hypothetical protein TEA_001945 [Camellia sinensis var. sinensis]|uniref:Mediator of RNA polymerase II transcription subunit 16 n=1 Tax=Camellia sinensis var. sinensis TaxID=542762 RepID=A0A4S4DW17_CAMSN|nr:hypothetical protein TEA_001945 [Camellia sinensis var. sinensis]